MKQDEIMKLFAYIARQRAEMEEEINRMQSNIRFRRIDIVDCVELMCAIQRYETFIDTTNKVLAILNLL